MLLQTNSYIVPRDKREEHARLVRKFRQVLLRLGCDSFEVYEQVGTNWAPGEPTGRYVQIMRFQDRKHQQAVQAAENADKAAQQVIREFCELINFPYQQQHGLFASGFYQSILVPTPRGGSAAPPRPPAERTRPRPPATPPAPPAESRPADPTSTQPDPAAAPEQEGNLEDLLPPSASDQPASPSDPATTNGELSAFDLIEDDAEEEPDVVEGEET